MTKACDEVGRPPVEVTCLLFEADERLLAVCAENDVSRSAILAPTEDRGTFESFLNRCTRLSRQFS